MPRCAAPGPTTTDALEFIRGNYERGVTDEFMEPAVVVRDGQPVAPDARWRCGDHVEFPLRPDAPDGARTGDAEVRRLRGERPSGACTWRR